MFHPSPYEPVHLNLDPPRNSCHVSETHLQRVLKEYVRYFNWSRPHQGIKQRVADPDETSRLAHGADANVIAFPVLGGLHHAYRRVA